jgi:hypothetical protein
MSSITQKSASRDYFTNGKEKANASPTKKNWVGFAFSPNGGGGGIRTHGTLSGTLDFEFVVLFGL